jgi:hypothetical protein
MNNLAPSQREWQELYAAATEFKKIEAWNWLDDSDVFGVQNPANGEIGYCCVMGALGEFFALGVYLGAEGLEGYLKILTGAVSREDTLHIQKCLTASFEDRESLDSQDLKLIKQLGLKFRGRNAWVAFRSYEPGYFPWYLAKEEASFLKIALEQAREVALMVRKEKRLLETAKKGNYLIRVPHAEGGQLVWENDYRMPVFPNTKSQGEEPAGLIDQNRIQRLTGKNHQPGKIWEVDLFFAPMPVREGESRPYFPRTALFVDHHSGYIFGSNFFSPSGYGSAFLEQFSELLEETDALPEQVLISNGEAQELIEPLAAKLRIKLKVVRRLGVVEKAKSSLFKRFLSF